MALQKVAPLMWALLFLWPWVDVLGAATVPLTSGISHAGEDEFLRLWNKEK